MFYTRPVHPLVSLGWPKAAASHPSLVGTVPRAIYGPYHGPRDTLEMMAKHALGDKGERSIVVRRFTEWIVGQIWPKAYDSEIIAIRHMCVQPSPWLPWMPMLKYLNDPRHVEFLRTPERCVLDIIEQGYCVIDCDESSCLCASMALQIGREVELVAMGFVPHQLSHVAVRVKEPKSGRWIILDGVAGPREKEAAGKAKELLIKSLD